MGDFPDTASAGMAGRRPVMVSAGQRAEGAAGGTAATFRAGAGGMAFEDDTAGVGRGGAGNTGVSAAISCC
ncbi:hypothetical protein A7S25_22075 [Salmonella enterica]|nr:hypothetical protein A7S25_22075 [Salmonella enterica]